MIYLKKKNSWKIQWAYRFLKRYDFSIRRISHIGKFIPREQNDIKSKFIEEFIKQRKTLDIGYEENERVINIDETPCCLDMNMDTTIDFIGNKHIEIINSD